MLDCPRKKINKLIKRKKVVVKTSSKYYIGIVALLLTKELKFDNSYQNYFLVLIFNIKLKKKFVSFYVVSNIGVYACNNICCAIML